MEQELSAYNEDRNREIALLLEKQRRELSQIDSEITNLGINVADLAESMQDIHFFSANSSSTNTPSNNHNRTSMISLHRSYSSNSFLSNSANNGNGTSSTTHK